MYSASMAEKFREGSFLKKCLMSHALTDDVYATTIKDMDNNKKDKYVLYCSAILTFWLFWGFADFLGALIGSSFPNIQQYGLDFAMVTAFIAIVVPQIKSQACTVAVLVASASGGCWLH